MKVYRIINDREVEVGDVVRDSAMRRYRVNDITEAGRLAVTCIDWYEGEKDVSIEGAARTFECYTEETPPDDKTRQFIKRKQAKQTLFDYWNTNL